jgi:hypothetical protein
MKNVIREFAQIGFDDTKGKQHCRELLVKLTKSYVPLPRDSDIKAHTIECLTILLKAIEEHKAEEFMALPETFDDKFNHRHALYWICLKEFQWAKSPSDEVPEWYPRMSSKMDWKKPCEEVIQSMLCELA